MAATHNWKSYNSRPWCPPITSSYFCISSVVLSDFRILTHPLQNNHFVFNIFNFSPYFYEAFCYYLQDLAGSLPFFLVNLLITQFTYPLAFNRSGEFLDHWCQSVSFHVLLRSFIWVNRVFSFCLSQFLFVASCVLGVSELASDVSSDVWIWVLIYSF